MVQTTRELPVTTFAVLAQLARRPSSGYDIQARLRATAGHFWHAAYSQIYAELRRLVQLGFATERHIEQTGRPNKRLYTITTEGRHALVAWLDEPWGLAHLRDASLVKLMSAKLLPPERVRSHLRGLHAAHSARVREFESAVEGIDRRSDPHLWIAMRKGIHAQRAFVAWCEEALDALEQSMPPSGSGDPRAVEGAGEA